MNSYFTNLSVLHISDLHRTPSKKINNSVLIDSLEIEKEQYVKEGLPVPNLIVITGDIVAGVRGDTQEDLLELKKQYDEAFEFISELAKMFVDGNRNRVIIVPGNHDVSRFHSKNSMKKIDAVDVSKKNEIKKRFFDGDSNIRWCWNTFEFFNIDNKEEYSNRFLLFSEFYKNFYNEKRNYSLIDDEQYDIFDFPEHNIVFIGFNSCYNNDHCNFMGSINPNCIANAARKLRDNNLRNRFKIAVWHHSTNGLPNRTDYIDSSILKKFIVDDYSIILHGHQHKHEAIYEHTKIGLENKLLICSAGTLCASAKEIPPGLTRQYHIINFDFSKSKISLYSRTAIEMTDDRLVIWQPDKSEIKNEFDLNKEDIKKFKISKEHIINVALDKITDGEFEEVESILEKLDFIDSSVRRLLLDCYIELRRHQKIIEKYNPPQNSKEILALLNALKENNNVKLLKDLINTESIKKSEDITIITECQNLMKWVNYYDK